MVELRKITEENFWAVLKLGVHESQKNFVATNVYSLAQAWLAGEEAHPFAIYADDTLVGFFMGGTFKDEKQPGGIQYYIWRFMTDKAYQGKGYGRAALPLAIDYFRQMGAKEITLSYEPENEVAAKLYASEGFVPTGEIDNGEAVAKLVL